MALVPDPRLARLLAAMRAVRDGDLGARVAVAGDDELAELGELFNQLAEHNQALAGQIAGISGGAVLERLTESVAATTVAASASVRAASDPGGHLAKQIALVEQARLDLNEHARQLALTSRAKAEFMANISHELRTPLSSLLILAQLLAANSEGNLTPRQVDFARTIHAAAKDLLQLINDLLDLANVETGRMAVHAERISVHALADRVQAAIRPQAVEKGLKLVVHVAGDVPEHIESDGQRLQQVLRNLLSNAVKFTEHGAITLEVVRDQADPGLLHFAVHDTGIGIEPDRHEAIFEAFQHGDGMTGQRFGGSGLGLSISRELARLLGGELRVSSRPGQGSTFTLTVPVESAAAREHAKTPAGTRAPQQARDSAGTTSAGDAVSGSDASSGSDSVIEHAGATETEDPTTGAGPAAAQSAEPTDHPALGSETPRPTAAVLVVEPRAARAMQNAARTAIDGLGGGMRGRVDLMTVPEVSAPQLERTLTGREILGVLVNLSTPRSQVQTLLVGMARHAPTVPVLAYEAGAGSGTAARLASLGSVPGLEVVGSRAQAAERLTLHLLTALPNSNAELSLAAEPPQSAVRFNGEKVLVVDDDVRNVFAMTSALELHGLSVLHADNGRQGIETLLQNPDIRLVLMDLMMPGMDGYAATEYIRGIDRFAELPIVAVTAKAMRSDEERSIAAGANAHVVKPVEIDVLLGIISSMIIG